VTHAVVAYHQITPQSRRHLAAGREPGPFGRCAWPPRNHFRVL